MVGAGRSPIGRRGGSSQHALDLACSSIASGREEIVLACGVEVTSLLPIGSDAVAGIRAGTDEPISRSYVEHVAFVDRFEGAERIADRYGVTRDDVDELARTGPDRALVSMCCGGGIGTGTVLERV